jgi:hypothetical protein
MGLEWGEELKEDNFASCDRKYIRLNLANLFKHIYGGSDDSHPVEDKLSWARMDTDFEDFAVFKEKRATILGCLEPQYERIIIASGNIVEFIKRGETQRWNVRC